MTPTTLTIAKKIFTFFAVVKYLFFPYITANAAGAADLNSMLGTNAVITCKDVTETAIWIGTTEGLYKVSKKHLTVQHFTTQNSALPSNHVTGICTNSNDNVFVATNAGVMRYDGYSYMVINTENTNLPTDNITAIACDGADNIWLGTANKGLVMLRGYKVKVYNTQNSILTDNGVVSLNAHGQISIDVKLANNSQIEITNQGMQAVNTTYIQMVDMIATIKE